MIFIEIKMSLFFFPIDIIRKYLFRLNLQSVSLWFLYATINSVYTVSLLNLYQQYRKKYMKKFPSFNLISFK